MVFLASFSDSFAVSGLMSRCLSVKSINSSKVPDKESLDLFPFRFLVSSRDGDISEPFSSLGFAELEITRRSVAMLPPDHSGSPPLPHYFG